jgi:hypothetical protein
VACFPVQSSKFLLALASTVILGPEFYGSHDRILLSDGSGSLQAALQNLESTEVPFYIHDIVILRLKSGIVEQEEAANFSQRRSKHDSAVTYIDARIE